MGRSIIREKHGVQIRGKDLIKLLGKKGFDLRSAAKEIRMSDTSLITACKIGRTSVGTVAKITRHFGIRPTGYVCGHGMICVDGQKLCDAVHIHDPYETASTNIGASPTYLQVVKKSGKIGRVYATLLEARYGIKAEEFAVNPPNGQQITFDYVNDEDTPDEETQDEPTEKKSEADGLAQAIAAGIEQGIAKATKIMANTTAFNYDMIHSALRDGIDYGKLALAMMYAFDLALERNKSNAHAAGNPLIQAFADEAKKREAADT